MEFNATFIVAFISFIVFVFVMNSILYKPISDIVLRRKKLVDSNYEDANRNIDQKVAILLDRDEKLAQAVENAKVRVAQKMEETTQKRDEITQNANVEAQSSIDKYNEYYKHATIQAKKVLNEETVNLAQLISDKILGSSELITEDEFNKLVKG